MVFIVGPRQVGKTWLAKDIMKEFKNPLYLNFDNNDHKKILKESNWLSDVDLVVFDEIHKMKNWKNYIKGVFDTKRENMSMLITGSSKLNAHRKAGDSMAGRYFLYNLMPFTYKEIYKETGDSLQKLFEKSGFPEPYFTEKDSDMQRWKSAYSENILRQDLLNISDVYNWQAFTSLFELLKHKIGSSISYANLASDLEISPITVKKYIQLLSDLYMIYTVKTYTKKISRSILKEIKVYFYNHDYVEDVGCRFENMIANHLYSYTISKKDIEGLSYSLAFIRTKEKKEIDFVIVDEKNNPVEIYETKVSDKKLSNELYYFNNKYNIPAKQIVYNLDIETQQKDISIVKAENFLKNL